MNNQPIVLCEEDLEGIHGGDAVSAAVSAVIGYVISKVLDQVPPALSALNSALGPPGTYNPYSNPINCEYGGYY